MKYPFLALSLIALSALISPLAQGDCVPFTCGAEETIILRCVNPNPQENNGLGSRAVWVCRGQNNEYVIATCMMDGTRGALARGVVSQVVGPDDPNNIFYYADRSWKQNSDFVLQGYVGEVTARLRVSHDLTHASYHWDVINSFLGGDLACRRP